MQEHRQFTKDTVASYEEQVYSNAQQSRHIEVKFGFTHDEKRTASFFQFWFIRPIRQSLDGLRSFVCGT